MKKSKLSKIFGITFLLVSLIAILGITNNPLKTVTIDSYARYSAEATINRRERAAAKGQGAACKGAGCLAPEIIANRNNAANKTGAAADIVALYDQASKGDAAAQAKLKDLNASVAEAAAAAAQNKAASDLAAQKKGCENEGGTFVNNTCYDRGQIPPVIPKSSVGASDFRQVAESSADNSQIAAVAILCQKDGAPNCNTAKGLEEYSLSVLKGWDPAAYNAALTKFNQNQTYLATQQEQRTKQLQEQAAAIAAAQQEKIQSSLSSNPQAAQALFNYKNSGGTASLSADDRNAIAKFCTESGAGSLTGTGCMNVTQFATSFLSLKSVTGTNAAGETITVNPINFYAPLDVNQIPAIAAAVPDNFVPQKTGLNNYATCNGSQDCNEFLTGAYKGLSILPGFQGYVSSFQNGNYEWKEKGFSSQKDCETKSQNGTRAGSALAAQCGNYIYTKDNLMSSIQLGSELTAAGALVGAAPGIVGAGVAAAGTGGGVLAIAGATAGTTFITVGAVTTMTQTFTAVNAQIKDPGSSEAWYQTGMAALSWANLGTADYLLKASSLGIPQMIKAARILNTGVSVLNLGVDVPTAISTCQQTPGLFTCGSAIGAVGADLFFGTLDIKQGQTIFGMSLTDGAKTPSSGLEALIKPKVDVPNPNGVRIATDEELSFLKSLEESSLKPIEPAKVIDPPNPGETVITLADGRTLTLNQYNAELKTKFDEHLVELEFGNPVDPEKLLSENRSPSVTDFASEPKGTLDKIASDPTAQVLGSEIGNKPVVDTLKPDEVELASLKPDDPNALVNSQQAADGVPAINDATGKNMAASAETLGDELAVSKPPAETAPIAEAPAKAPGQTVPTIQQRVQKIADDTKNWISGLFPSKSVSQPSSSEIKSAQTQVKSLQSDLGKIKSGDISSISSRPPSSDYSGGLDARQLNLDSASEKIKNIDVQDFLAKGGKVEDLKDILLSGKLNGTTLPDSFPGRSNYQDWAAIREFYFNSYIENPEFTRFLAENNVTGAHGTTSASLYGISQNGLLSQDEMRARGLILSSGEGVFGSSNFNNTRVSLAQLGSADVAVRYSIDAPQTIDNLTRQIDSLRQTISEIPQSPYLDSLKIKLKGLEDTRAFLQSPSANATESLQKLLVEKNFPTVYLVKDNPGNPGYPLGGLDEEYLVNNQIPREDIKAILVPADQVDFVKSLTKQLGWDVDVHPIESTVGYRGAVPESRFTSNQDSLLAAIENPNKVPPAAPAEIPSGLPGFIKTKVADPAVTFWTKYIKDDQGLFPWLRSEPVTPTSKVSTEPVPSDLTKVETAPDGDTFVSAEGEYEAAKADPTVQRRVNDTLARIKNMTPEEVAAQIVASQFIDPLTGLNNKQGFAEALDYSVAAAKANKTDLTVVTIDLRKFKSINDELGHLTGDEALKKVAELIKSELRTTDIGIRVSGDEFSIILPETNAAQAQKAMDRILGALSAEKSDPGSPAFLAKVNIDYGIKQWDPETDTVEAFLKELDKKMYEMKRGAGGETTIPQPQQNIFQKAVDGVKKFFSSERGGINIGAIADEAANRLGLSGQGPVEPQLPKNPTGEEKVANLTAKVDTLIQKEIDTGTVTAKTYTPEFGCRSGICGYASDYVAAASPLYGFEPTEYQISDLNIARGLTPDNTFRHAITVLKDTTTGEYYLVDVTFEQFIDSETGIVRQLAAARTDGKEVVTIFTKDDPLIQEILNKKYIKLTPEKLNKYLQITSSSTNLPATDLNILNTETGKFTVKLSEQELSQKLPELLPQSQSHIPEAQKINEDISAVTVIPREEAPLYDDISKRITGLGINDPGLPSRLIEDRDIIRAKYGLPNIELKTADPAEYVRQLEKIAKDNGYRVAPLGEINRLLKVYPYVGGLHTTGGVTDVAGVPTLFVLRDPSDPLVEAKVLEHELIHAIQGKRYPSLPIEAKEYETYLGPLRFPEVLARASAREGFYDSIEISSGFWYNNNNLPLPWKEIPNSSQTLSKMPQEAAVDIEIPISENPNIFQKAADGIKSWFNGIINPKLGIVQPDVANLLNLEWRGFRDTEGKFQWPIQKSPSIAPIIEEPNLPRSNVEIKPEDVIAPDDVPYEAIAPPVEPVKTWIDDLPVTNLRGGSWADVPDMGEYLKRYASHWEGTWNGQTSTLTLTPVVNSNILKEGDFFYDTRAATVKDGKVEFLPGSGYKALPNDSYGHVYANESDFPRLLGDDELIFRGINYEGMEYALQNGLLTSGPTMQSRGLGQTIFFGTSGNRAISYAAEGEGFFAMSTFEKPSYVVTIKKPANFRTDNLGDILIDGSVPVDQIVKVYEVRPYAMTDMKFPLWANYTDMNGNPLSNPVMWVPGVESFPPKGMPKANFMYRELTLDEVKSIFGIVQ